MPAPARSRPPRLSIGSPRRGTPGSPGTEIVGSRTRLLRQSARLALPGGGLTLACVADTHSQPHAAIAERLAAIAPDAILHAGDIGDPAVVDRLAAAAPVFAVRGNIDTR